MSERLTAKVSERPESKFGITVFTDLIGVDTFGMNAEATSDGVAKTRGVENGARANDLIARETRIFPSEIG